MLVVILNEKLGSLLMADDNSANVSKALGAMSSNFEIAESVYKLARLVSAIIALFKLDCNNDSAVWALLVSVAKSERNTDSAT